MSNRNSGAETYPAWADFGDGARPRYCTVSNVSSCGARLSKGSNDDFPDRFELWLEHEGRMRCLCGVTWQTSYDLGVRFLES